MIGDCLTPKIDILWDPNLETGSYDIVDCLGSLSKCNCVGFNCL